MGKYLISFPSSALDFAGDDLAAISAATRAVMREAKAAGVWVFGGGLDESVPPALVSGDGTATEGSHPQTRRLDGGFTVLELPSREAALAWAAKMAAACQCAQELREFMYDPES